MTATTPAARVDVAPGTCWVDNYPGNRGRTIRVTEADTGPGARYAWYVVVTLADKALNHDGTVRPGWRDTRRNQPKRILLNAFHAGPARTGYSPAARTLSPNRTEQP
ncbi:hypothetical protein [Actinomadura yumaensis]|uniref:Uncharacterized protein n=1 Tax=Actinomadura yumaensis TaxID=111807 RepID=A0ABW2CRT9_9ACTN